MLCCGFKKRMGNTESAQNTERNDDDVRSTTHVNVLHEDFGLMEHPPKEHIKEKVRDIQQYLKTVVLSQLSEALAKGIREVSKQLDDILQEADTKLQESEKYDERRELFKAAQELIEEYSSKLQSYKDSLARKPTVAKPKDKFKKRF